MQEQIVAVLARASEEGQRYVSGGLMAKELGITRAAVWKYIESIRQDGAKVLAAPRLGYRLANLENVLQAGAVQMTTSIVGRSYIYLPEVDSTNSEAKRRMRSGCRDGLVIVAENQTAGRGRMGRKWHSVPGKGLYFSVVLFPERLPINRASLLVPLTAVAVCKAIINAIDLPVVLKWPNDLLYQGQKLGGILLEAGGEADSVKYAILGIGINANLVEEDIPPELSTIVTSISLAQGKPVGRRTLLQEILTSLDAYYNKFFQQGSEAFLDEYRDLCWTLGKPIKFLWQDQTWSGIAQGIESDGGLRVQLENEDILVLRSGDVHCI